MDINFKKHIIYPALQIIKTDSKIKRFYFFPGTISVIFLSGILVYQVIYTYVILLGNEDAILEYLLSFVHSDYTVPLLISSLIFLVVYFISLPIFEGGLIRYIHQKGLGETSRSDAVGFGIFRFATLFEFNNLTGIFKLMSIINAYLFSLRFLGTDYIGYMSLIFGIGIILSSIIHIFTAYARYEIILNNAGVFDAIGTSTKVMLINIKTTLKLYLLMLLMQIKVLINFFVFLSFPILSAVILGLISSQFLSSIIIIVLSILFLFILLVLGYMAGVLDIFKTAAWYQAYKIGKKKLEEV